MIIIMIAVVVIKIQYNHQNRIGNRNHNIQEDKRKTND